MLTAIKLMQVIIDKKQPLSELTKPVTIYPQVLKNLRVSDKDAVLNHPAVQAKVEEVTAKLEGNGRILLRKSGTEPVLRVMVEAPSYAECEEYVNAVIGVMNSL